MNNKTAVAMRRPIVKWRLVRKPNVWLAIA
jgi:hypothetical protein